MSLQAGVAVEGLDAMGAPDCYYTIVATAADVADEKMLFVYGSAAEMHDVYVKFGSPANSGPYACLDSIVTWNDDPCEVFAPQVGTYHLRVTRRDSGTGAFSLTASYGPPTYCSLGAGDTPLPAGVPVTANVRYVQDGNGRPLSHCHFVFAPSPDESVVQVRIDSAASNLRLQGQVGAWTNPPWYGGDCKTDTGYGNSPAFCTVRNTGQPVYAAVFRESQYGGNPFTLTARSFTPCSLGAADYVLTDGVAVTADLASERDAVCMFRFDPLPGHEGVEVTARDVSGSSDKLAVKVGSPAWLNDYDCHSSPNGACSVLTGSGESVYVIVYDYSGPSSIEVKATARDRCSLGPGSHLLTEGVTTSASLLRVGDATCTFSFTAADTLDLVRVKVDNARYNQPDLRVTREGSSQTVDCIQSSTPTTQICDFFGEPGATYDAQVVWTGNYLGGAVPFDITASSVQVPLLDNGVPIWGRLAADSWQFWKVVLPAKPGALAVAVAGDAERAACDAADYLREGGGERRNDLCPLDTPTLLEDPAFPGWRGGVTHVDLKIWYTESQPPAVACESKGFTSNEACLLSNPTSPIPRKDAWLPQRQPLPGPGKYIIGLSGEKWQYESDSAGPADFALVALFGGQTDGEPLPPIEDVAEGYIPLLGPIVFPPSKPQL